MPGHLQRLAQRLVQQRRILVGAKRPLTHVGGGGAVGSARDAVAEHRRAGAAGEPLLRPSRRIDGGRVGGLPGEVRQRGRVQLGAVDASGDAGAHRRGAQRQITEVDHRQGRALGGRLVPQHRQRLGQELQRAAGPLEPRQRADALVEAVDQRRMERVARPDPLAVRSRVLSGGAERLRLALGQLGVEVLEGGQRLLCGSVVDVLEEAPPQDVADLVVVGGTADRALRAGHDVVGGLAGALRRHTGYGLDELGRVVGERRGSCGEREYQPDGRGRGGRLEQDLERLDGGLLLAAHVGVLRTGELGEVQRQFVDDDQRRASFEGLHPELLARRRALAVAALEARPHVGAELAGDLPPEGEGRDPGGAVDEAVERVELVADHGGDGARLLGQQSRGDEVRNVGRPGAPGEMPERDQAVSLAAPERGLIAVYRISRIRMCFLCIHTPPRRD